MDEKELFVEVLNNFKEKYNLDIQRPYNDTYIVIYDKNGHELGSMNYGGYNLHYNLKQLIQILD